MAQANSDVSSSDTSPDKCFTPITFCHCKSLNQFWIAQPQSRCHAWRLRMMAIPGLLETLQKACLRKVTCAKGSVPQGASWSRGICVGMSVTAACPLHLPLSSPVSVQSVTEVFNCAHQLWKSHLFPFLAQTSEIPLVVCKLIPLGNSTNTGEATRGRV